jgi:hypothetical protein
MAENDTQISAEFEKLPLEFLVAIPLIAAVNAQSKAALATKEFIQSLIKDGKPITVDFSVNMQETLPPATKDGALQTISKNVQINAPLLSIVPIPHLRIDSLTAHFKFEISQVVKTSKEKSASAELGAQSGALLSPWVSATLKGSASSKSSEESTMNRSGFLEITVNASEAPMPEGLAKILGLLANSIQAAPAT